MWCWQPLMGEAVAASTGACGPEVVVLLVSGVGE
jgi:hypothetical protein